jgi:hypothetical protein
MPAARSGVDLTRKASAHADAELVQLRLRVIALADLVLALLAHGPNRQRDVAFGMAASISPRPGSTAHRLTIRAAAWMVQLVEPAQRLRATAPR